LFGCIIHFYIVDGLCKGKLYYYFVTVKGKVMIAITGGGTGGHIFPNAAIIEELNKRGVREIIWLGAGQGKEREWAEKLNVRFFGICTGKLRRYFSLKNITDLMGVIFGVFQSFFILLRHRPSVLFSKGGFVSVPPVVASWLLRVPIITHESDIEPGLATKIISRFASVVCVSFEDTESFFIKKKVVHTGNPVRSFVKDGDREKGLQFLGFQKDLPVVFVIGGSLGAASINSAVREMCNTHKLNFNLAHQCGRGNLDKDLLRKDMYFPLEFVEKEMGDVLAAADLVVSRAGAGAIFEIGYMKKPSILVPLPKSKSRGEQIENAHYFEKNGASLIVRDENLNGGVLYETINRLLSDKKTLRMIGEKAGSLCRFGAEKSIADIVLGYCKQ
jgi:UDP-N-acetylglucosamine--N-acetylmuramyl-(pentapeptide) pyrophosphoryl-undecaprenol N-acetylglucosamine transferase